MLVNILKLKHRVYERKIVMILLTHHLGVNDRERSVKLVARHGIIYKPKANFRDILKLILTWFIFENNGANSVVKICNMK